MKGFRLSSFQRITSSGRFIPEIDGLRFLAIATVILFHASTYYNHKSPFAPAEPDAWFMSVCRHGYVGVMLFFAISGFVLALPFAQWRLQGAKPISLKAYFLRRLTRLEPPYLLTLTAVAAVLLLQRSAGLSEILPHWGASAVYLHNLIYGQPSTLVGVAWSLEIEIQFYLLAPLLFRVFTIRQQPARYALYVGAMVLFSCFSYRFDPEVSGFKTLAGYFQYFCAGILLADWYTTNPSPASLRLLEKWFLPQLLGVILLILLLTSDLNHSLAVRLWYPFAIIGFYALVLRNPFWQKIGSTPWLVTIGGMCYSIYLWHYLLISRMGAYSLRWHFSDGYGLDFLIQLCLWVTGILLFSSLFFYFIEKPCMRKDWYKTLFSSKISPNPPARP